MIVFTTASARNHKSVSSYTTYNTIKYIINTYILRIAAQVRAHNNNAVWSRRAKKKSQPKPITWVSYSIETLYCINARATGRAIIYIYRGASDARREEKRREEKNTRNRPKVVPIYSLGRLLQVYNIIVAITRGVCF